MNSEKKKPGKKGTQLLHFRERFWAGGTTRVGLGICSQSGKEDTEKEVSGHKQTQSLSTVLPINSFQLHFPGNLKQRKLITQKY